ncbi:MAG: helix-turn-helix transcriptional regulator [Chloroflexi bacterium]|nr:helix-turn-helix transcriptional regulator [Chloroflexota bacterium]
MDSFLAAFASHLRTLRLQRGLSQEEVAHRAGLHVTYVSGIERGRRNPSVKSLYRIAQALGVPVKELFEFEGPAP